jgi:hypothetical protein
MSEAGGEGTEGEGREERMLEEIRTLLRGGDVRIELGFSLSITGAHPTARLYRRKGSRWAKVDPLLLPREGGTHADLLDLLAGLSRGESDVEFEESPDG